MKDTKQWQPWHPEPYEVADAAALQAMQGGNASAPQQQRALKWIIQCARTYDSTYFPESSRNTDFAEGKRAVGLQLVKLLNIKLGLIKKDQEETENG